MKVTEVIRGAFGHSLTLVAVGFTALSVSGVLMAEHIERVSEVRAIAVPLVAEMPALERRLNMLTEQVELAELHAALRVGSKEEQVFVYVLPREFDIDRLLSLFDLLNAHFTEQGQMADMSPISFGDDVQTREGYVSRPIDVSFALHEDATLQLLTLLRLAGTLTISDALTIDELALLFERTEAENPAGIVALEQFLSTDLLEYALSPRAHEDRLLRSFSSNSFNSAFQTVLQSSLLRDARQALGGPLGKKLEEYEAWPLPIMTVEGVRETPGAAKGWSTLSLQLHVYRRAD